MKSFYALGFMFCATGHVDDGLSPGPLSGVPLAIKDNICTSTLPTTCSSAMLADFTPPYDATAVALLRASGASIVGKTNCDEFGMGSLNMYSSHGPVINPFSPSTTKEWRNREQRSAGGSSGGSAAAVASDMCFAALGTDTGGSIRLPASYCGVVGLKPSYGLISRWGVVSYADSLDTVGVLATSTDKVKQLVEIVAQPDVKDPTSIPRDIRDEAHHDVQSCIERISLGSGSGFQLSGLRIGVPKEYFPTELDGSIKSRFHRTLSTLKVLGATVASVSLPSTQYALSAYYVIASAEASSNLARYDGLEYGARHAPDTDPAPTSVADVYAATRSAAFGPEVIRRVLLGSYALSADAFDNYFLQAQRVRNLVRRDFDRVFAARNVLSQSASAHSSDSSSSESARVDIIMHPSAIRTAPLLDPIASSEQTSKLEPSLESYLQDVLTVPASLAGIPCLSVPMPASNDQEWPVGVSISGQWGSDRLLLHVGKALEEAFKAASARD